MKILILDGPRDARAAKYKSYRGSYRAHPTYCNGFPDEAEINQMFFWFLQEGKESGLVRDLTKAVRYAELLNSHLSKFDPQFTGFEVIEATNRGEAAQAGGQLLGFDLSADYNNSLLWWGL